MSFLKLPNLEFNIGSLQQCYLCFAALWKSKTPDPWKILPWFQCVSMIARGCLTGVQLPAQAALTWQAPCPSAVLAVPSCFLLSRIAPTHWSLQNSKPGAGQSKGRKESTLHILSYICCGHTESASGAPQASQSLYLSRSSHLCIESSVSQDKLQVHGDGAWADARQTPLGSELLKPLTPRLCLTVKYVFHNSVFT